MKEKPTPQNILFNRREVLSSAMMTTAGIAALSLSTERPAVAAERDHPFHPLEKFKYDLGASQGWSGKGGSAKQVNVDQFPVSKSIAGVSMRVEPGAIRELHWHAIAAEWAYILEGNVRTTVISPDGQADDVYFSVGDVWYFPRGYGHALQCVGPRTCHFLLGFDNGNFSEFGTFSITDWLAVTHPAIAARNLGISVSALAGFPKEEAYIVPGTLPPPVPSEPFRGGSVPTSQSVHKFRMAEVEPHRFPGGTERVVTAAQFPIQTTMSAVLMHLEVGALRELHWHPNADEWFYVAAGCCRVGLFGAHGRHVVDEFRPGQVGFVKQGFGHYIEQLGDEPTQLIILFNSPVYQEISLSKWLAGNPAQLIADNLGVSQTLVDQMPKHWVGIFGAQK